MDETLAMMFELFAPLPRHGPGSVATTLRALRSLPPFTDGTRVVDLGCGDGTHMLVVLEHTPARVVGVDIMASFVETANARIAGRGYGDRGMARVADMGAMPDDLRDFDVAWCESAVYNLGFENGLRALSGLLKPGGYAVVTEVCWKGALDDVPAPCRAFWAKEYPNMPTLDRCLRGIPDAGFEEIARFDQPESDWWDEYYTPLEGRLDPFLARHPGNPVAHEVVASARLEIACRREHGAHYDYVAFVLRKR